MLINVDLYTDTSSASRRPLAEAGAAASQPSSALTNGSAASQMESSLQRLTDAPAGAPDAEWEIQDETGATQASEQARQDMSRQPGTTLAAQANQFAQNVLSLLQAAD
jgi:flagellin-like hook-associated protein FlgL